MLLVPFKKMETGKWGVNTQFKADFSNMYSKCNVYLLEIHVTANMENSYFMGAGRYFALPPVLVLETTPLPKGVQWFYIILSLIHINCFLMLNFCVM